MAGGSWRESIQAQGQHAYLPSAMLWVGQMYIMLTKQVCVLVHVTHSIVALSSVVQRCCPLAVWGNRSWYVPLQQQVDNFGMAWKKTHLHKWDVTEIIKTARSWTTCLTARFHKDSSVLFLFCLLYILVQQGIIKNITVSQHESTAHQLRFFFVLGHKNKLLET